MKNSRYFERQILFFIIIKYLIRIYLSVLAIYLLYNNEVFLFSKTQSIIVKIKMAYDVKFLMVHPNTNYIFLTWEWGVLGKV